MGGRERVLVPTGASAVAEPDRVEEVNCDAVQVVIRVPPQNIDPLVPEEFKLRLNKEMAGLAIGFLCKIVDTDFGENPSLLKKSPQDRLMVPNRAQNA